MNQMYTFIERQKRAVFALSVLLLFFWTVSNCINVYKYIIVGAVFELLWLPMLLLFFLLPIINLVMLIKNKLSLKSLWFYGLLLNVAMILFLIQLY